MRHFFSGSRRLPPPGSAAASGGSSCCCAGKAGGPATSASTGRIPGWAQRKRPRRRKATVHRLERTLLTAPNQVWSMDFVADALFDGRRFRALTVVDTFTKESLAIEVHQQLKGDDVVAVMERLRHQRDLPQRIQTDNGNGFISIVMDRRPTTMAWSRITPVPVSPPTTRSSNRSTVVSETSGSTPTGSCRRMTPARRSKAGGSTKIISGRTRRLGISRRQSSLHDSPLNPRPSFPFYSGLVRRGRQHPRSDATDPQPQRLG